ncbi:MAG: hypothetical protein KDE50_06175, partial [Caldilineaceae bacterium]|nr:hypothetical protein [Caldilineaceae bacterium]
RFFDHWLKEEQNGVMDEPALTWFRRQYTEPEPFPDRLNGAWHSEANYPPPDRQEQTFYLGEQTLTA